MEPIKINLDKILNTADAGLDLARKVVPLLMVGQPVKIDCVNAWRMTPSFANAFVMTMLEQVGAQTVAKLLQVVNAQPTIISALSASAASYKAGNRLSTQRAPAIA